jgi:hypothetical protein
MIRAWFAGKHDSVYPVSARIGRYSNFDPNGPPQSGNFDELANTSNGFYVDYAIPGLGSRCYAYAVKILYSDGEWYDWAISNVICKPYFRPVTVEVELSDGTLPEDACVEFLGSYEYSAITPVSGIVHFEEFATGTYYFKVSKPGYEPYVVEEMVIDTNNTYIHVLLDEIKYPVDNLSVNEEMLATWDPVRISILNESFDTTAFPPAGWYTESNGSGWQKGTEGSSPGFTISEWDSHYLFINDDIDPGNDGCCDYLVTPPLDLRQPYDFILVFDSFFNGENGQKAFIGYSHDLGATWHELTEIQPDTIWRRVTQTLEYFTGPLGDKELLLRFHADDNGGQASGWAIDNVLVFVPGPSASVIAYELYVDDVYQVTTTDTSWQITTMTGYDEEFKLCVNALYSSGGIMTCTTDTSTYFGPPKNMLIRQDSLTWDSPGNDMFLSGYKIYRSDEEIDFIGPETVRYPRPVSDTGNLMHCTSAVYDLDFFGFPGETKESEMVCDEFTGLGENNFQQSFTVHPNPASDFIRVKTYSEITGYKLCSSAGKVLLEIDAIVGTSAKIKLEDIPDGIYLLRVNTTNGLFSEKIMVIR